MRHAWILVLGWAFIAGCPEDEGCHTTADCAEQGLTLQRCVSGQCLRVCERDQDCTAAPQSCEDGDTECMMQQAAAESSVSVCESLLCVSGCPTEPCAAGEQCVEGRCASFFESFEPSQAGQGVTLESLGWNHIARDLRNSKAKVVFTGVPGCGLAAAPEVCAGPSADGEHYLIVQREPIPSRGQLVFGVTCAACRCCLECRDPTTRTSTTSRCPGVTNATVDMCTDQIPGSCQAICTACDGCTAAPMDRVGTGLTSCEQRPAERICSACVAHDACVAMKLGENRACPGGNYPACATPPQTESECNECLTAECETTRDSCFACRDAEKGAEQFPEEPELWRDALMTCRAQGDDGCWAAPVDVLRSDLDEDEQSLESGPIDLSSASGSVALEFEFVPFDVGQTYLRVLQGQPPSSWPEEKQEVAVQLCASACEQSASWKDASFIGGGAASIPDDEQRGNGLQYAGQASFEWSANSRQVEIPDAMRTATFRFRFVPRLDDGAQIGIDKIRIRRRR